MWLNPQETADFVIFTENMGDCAVRSVVNISFNNEQKQATDSVRKEQINGFKKRQQRTGAIISVLIFSCQFSLFGLIFWKIY